MTHKALSNEPDPTFDRLVEELRGPDTHLMTLAGAVKMLIVSRSEALEENRALKKEVEKLRLQVTE